MAAKSGASVLLLLGKDRWPKEEVVREVRERWMRNAFQRQMDETVLRADAEAAVTLTEIVDTASTLPMMAERRVVVVYGFDLVKGAKDLMKAYPEPARTAVLVLVSSEGEYYRVLDKAFVAEFGRAYGELGQVRNFYDPTPDELRRWVSERAAREGKRLTPDALETLVEIAGTELAVLAQELAKLFLWDPAKTEYGEEDVVAAVSGDVGGSVEAVRDAVLARDAAEALRRFRRFVARYGRSELLLLLGELARQFRLLCRAHEVLASEGGTVDRVLARPEFGLKHWGLRKRVAEALRAYSAAEVERCLGMFYPMDRILKSRREGEAEAYFERFLLALCGRGKAGRRR